VAGTAQDGDAGLVTLGTKLVAPPRRQSAIDRSHLLDRLDAFVRLPLTLVCAPAGFGKTTLLTDWLARAPLPAAWLAVDNADNDPTRFWTYVLAALRRVEPGLGAAALALLQARHGPPVDVVVSDLVHDLAALDQPLAFVIDDYHLIDTSTVHRGVAFLVDHLPSQVHLVIGTRVDPPLPLARLRARAQLGELRSTDLRLSSGETGRFLNNVMGVDLTAGQVAQLEARTEGWLAGLQLAALSMRGRTDLDAFVAAFTGSHRFIVDYLIEDVLEREPEAVQAFLHETSILDRLTAGLCDAVTARQDGQEMLDRAERENLFVVPLDDERRWYRYHHLFADALRQRLRRRSPERLRELNQRASSWFAEHGMVSDAVDHALAAEDWERAAELIGSRATALVDRGEHATLDRWLATAPGALYRSSPLLAVRAAEARTLLGDFQSADALMDQLKQRQALAEGSVLGYAAALQARIAVLRDDSAAAVAHGQRALELLPMEDDTARASALVELGSGWLLTGDLAAAEAALHEALSVARRAGARAEEWTTLVRLARLAIARGRLHGAATYFQAILAATADLRVMPRTIAEYRLGALKYEWDQLDEADGHVERAIGLDERTTGRRLLGAWLWGIRADLLRGRGDFAGALSALEQARLGAERLQNLPERRRIRATVAYVSILAGDLSSARDWAREVSAEPSDDVPANSSGREDEVLVRARLYLAEGVPARATSLLLEPLMAAESSGRINDAIRFLVVLAVAWDQLGDHPRALATVGRALDLAEPGGYIRTFLDEGPPMVGLLLRVKPARDYVTSLLRSVGQDADSKRTLSPVGGAPTERELEVLRLIAEGLDNAQIAEQLVISVNTVKSHAHHLLNKLDATNRMHLVARARELRLLS
jgi:LuxR family maltose regulon positive regulatory protein